MRLRFVRFAARNIGTAAITVAAACGLAPTARAQPSLTPAGRERARLAELVGDTSLADAATRDLLARLAFRQPSWARVRGLGPAVEVTYNSALPYSLNDGALWAGRGMNLVVTGGLALERPIGTGVLTLAIAPTLAYSENRPFQFFPDTTPERSAFANFFHGRDASLDLPHRFGDRHVLAIHPGWSRLEYRHSTFAYGVTAADAWWGPGTRNALLVSSNAPGIPRLYARSASPRRTPVGMVSAELFSGTLTESLFFSEAEPDHRAISGVRIEVQPSFDTTLTLGAGRVVYSPITSGAVLGLTLARSFDALVRWGRTEAPDARADQLYSLWARWRFPAAGFEAYGEWARRVPPASATELLTAGHRSSGYTAGFQWAVRRPGSTLLLLQAELTWLEQSRVFADRPPRDFYSGVASAHGYTNRGQVIGAAIGPGASSQWLALDWIAREWRAGAFGGRVRWDNDALYRQPVPTFLKHDVSVLGGIRGGFRGAGADLSLELTAARRFNYLFQNGFINPGGYRTVDVNNFTLRLTATPR